MVAKGSALIAVVNVSTPPGVVMIYDIRFTTTTGKASICDVQLMKIGANLCADDKINATFTSSDSSAFNDGANATYGAANIDTAASSLDADNFVS
ncbi:hypothetical protein DPMN_121641 [Dreissena polymorpha]|uniref:Uncharacterized protein n=1 Tax=Dreissena polymorpha TaxID=45954 RepID=A0A9D4GN67_DREPO|nr:hypothetical protein DPMN_121641 [Dreissena polymorpha]